MKTKFFRFEDIILFEDDDIVVINKPPGVSSLQERNQPETGLSEMAKRKYGDIFICHRLDKHTTGAMIFAKNAEAHRDISIQFEKRKVEKRYHTIIKGCRELDEFLIDLPLGPLKNGIVRPDFTNGKHAITVVSSLKLFQRYTLLDCVPLTGRSHQIRVHLASMNCPIIGDRLYGGEDLNLSKLKRGYRFSKEVLERPLNDGYLLHSKILAIDHPLSKERLRFEAPYLKNFQVSIDLLEKYDSLTHNSTES